MTLPSSVKDRVLEAVRARPSPRRTEPRLTGWAAAALAALSLAGVLFLWGGPSNAVGRPPEVGEWVVVGMVALAVTATWLALPSRRAMLPPPASRLLGVALGVPLVVAAWLLAWHATYDDPFTRFGWRCFALTAASAPWPFAALLRLAPRFVPSRPWLLGGALGAVAGSWAAVVVEAWCPLAGPAHLAVGHVLPLVLLVAAGALLGQRLLRLRLA
jgi:hypothetical protein